MKPYQQIPIIECSEPLLPIPLAYFSVEDPHPYVKVGAPYADRSPYYLRQSVLERLLQAQHHLQQTHPGWRIRLFDAYRPIAVQQFMVDYSFQQLLEAEGLEVDRLTATQRQQLLDQVYQFWAAPSLDAKTPPPHSTGAAIDVTLVDNTGQPINMGSPIDEMSPRSFPNYFADLAGIHSTSDTADPSTVSHAQISSIPTGHPSATDPTPAQCLEFHQNRQRLQQVMLAAGFRQHPQEWWHFSLGDQLWAWLLNQEVPGRGAIARYGAVY